MTWNIASAKQQFSEVVRLTAEEPQAIYNRDKPVAVLISAQEYEEFKAWQAQKNAPRWPSSSTRSGRCWPRGARTVSNCRRAPPATTPWSMTRITGIDGDAGNAIGRYQCRF